jgi:hypothetical protein
VLHKANKPLLYILRIAVLLLILVVTVKILLKYVDYFPLNFKADFLLDREHLFASETSKSTIYQIAFYIHIITSPFLILNGLILISKSIRNRWLTFHRIAGYIQIFTVLFLLMPTSIVMSNHAYTGWKAGASFFILSLATSCVTFIGMIYAIKRQISKHRIWMTRSFILLSSAISLRIFSGSLSLFPINDYESAYIVAAWASWLIPSLTYEIILTVKKVMFAGNKPLSA